MREQRFRSRVVAYARKHGIDAAAKNYKIAEKDVRKWMGCDTSQPANSGIGISSSQRYVVSTILDIGMVAINQVV